MPSARTWSDLEDEVRAVPKTIWGTPFDSRVMFGRQIDAYAELERGRAVAIEVTEKRSITKLQEDLNKLLQIRNANFSKNILTECLCIVPYEPTTAMLNACASINISVYRLAEFRHKFLPFDTYQEARSKRPFGSAIDPATGQKDGRQYVVVKFRSEVLSECDIEVLNNNILQGKHIVLTGEYGTGKSKCVERLFDLLAAQAWDSFLFPISVDLRSSWGLRDRYEIIRRHLEELNLGAHSDAFIKAYNDGYLLLLIDGFDELATQAWSDNPETMIAVRSEALSGVRDLLSHQESGLIVCGREHYFDSTEELLASLGLAGRDPVFVHSHDEFSYEEIASFLNNAGYDYDVPEWLPRKPLTCEFFVRLFNEMGIEIAQGALDPMQFWDLFFGAVCDRESQIHASFDAETIKRILVAVAAATRTKPGDIGPLSLREVQDAFEAAVGYAPIEQAGVLLQRLPGLGRTAADTQDRRFVDTYLLEGLRAIHVIDLLSSASADGLQQDWLNPISENGLLISGQKIAALNLTEDAIGYCRRHFRERNKTLIFDVVCSILLSGIQEVDFGESKSTVGMLLYWTSQERVFQGSMLKTRSSRK